MTFITQTQCCTMLGIDPKTLRNWLRLADIQFTTHPTDARLKCLTDTHLQHLAALHHRPLPLTPSVPLSPASDADLHLMLLPLQTQVTTLQDQLAELTLEVVRQREQHRHELQALVKQLMELHLSQPIPLALDLPQVAQEPEHSPLADKRTPSRVLPLIASTATGTYVVISPLLGELAFSPDSPPWFAWLATLNSFRFLGQQGRLSTYRNRGRSCWMAYRRIHGHRYEYALGHTELLTLNHLEQMAATLQSHATSLC